MTKIELNSILSKEPNHTFFNYEGIVCEIKRHPDLLHLCGYVYIPKEHPWFKNENINASVHGGITYSSLKNDYWVIGFDCAHGGDLIPGMFNMLMIDENDDIYRDIKYVQNECIELASQVWKFCNKDLRRELLSTISQRLAFSMLSES